MNNVHAPQGGVTFRYSPARGVAFCDGALMKRPRINQMDTEGG